MLNGSGPAPVGETRVDLSGKAASNSTGQIRLHVADQHGGRRANGSNVSPATRPPNEGRFCNY